MTATITAAIVTENAFLRQTFGADYAAWQAGAVPPSSGASASSARCATASIARWPGSS